MHAYGVNRMLDTGDPQLRQYDGSLKHLFWLFKYEECKSVSVVSNEKTRAIDERLEMCQQLYNMILLDCRSVNTARTKM